MKKVYIFHIVTSLLLFTSLAVIYIMVSKSDLFSFGGNLSSEGASAEIRPVLPSTSKGEAVPGAPPFTLEEFVAHNRSKMIRGGSTRLNSHKSKLPVLMKEYLYTPGLPVSMYDSENLDVANEETLPGDGIFYLREHVRQGEGLVYEVLVSKYGRDYTMYIPEDSLKFAEFYGSRPPFKVVQEYEARRAALKEIAEQRSATLQASYEAAIDDYWAAEAKRNAGFFGFLNWSTIQASVQGKNDIGVYVAVGAAMVFVFAFMLVLVVRFRRYRPWERDVTFDDITDNEPELEMSPEVSVAVEPEAEEYPSYSPFSERGADYYDSKEDTLADPRF